MTKSVRLASTISSLTENLAESDLRGLARMIMSGKVRRDTPQATVEDIVGKHGLTLDLIVYLLRNWVGPRSGLATALITAGQVREDALARMDSVSLVWTGPVQSSIPMRSTMATTREMIKEAKRSVTIVGYRITIGSSPIFEALAERFRHGVRIRLILDKAGEQYSTIQRLWPYRKQIPQVYNYSSKGTLHAKLTLVDAKDMLVTSANLTYHGLRSNMEIGVRITGPSASQVDALVSMLIRDGYFSSMP